MDNMINHVPILEELEKKFKDKTWDEEDVLRWCQQVETIYVADPDAMWKFMDIRVEVRGGRVMLPSNLYKLIDVYDPDTSKPVRFNRTGMVIKQLIGYRKKAIALNYIGTPVDKDCIPLINEDHFSACETLCKINGFEVDALYNDINQGMYQDWKQRFDGMIQGVKGGFRNWSAQEFNDMVTIQGNEIPRVGRQPLLNNYYGQKDNDNDTV